MNRAFDCDRFVSRCIRAAVTAVVLVGMAMAACEKSAAQGLPGELIPQTVALRHGLHRRWAAQVQMDPARDRLIHVTLDRDVLCIQTRNSVAQVLEAETGGTRWMAQIGTRGAPSSELAANEHFVAGTNGTTLYVLDLATGKPVFERQLDGVPFAAPAINDTRVFVPMFNGMLISYLLHKPKAEPWVYRASGHILAKPLVTPKTVVWGTAKGNAYLNDLDKVKMRFQLKTNGEIVSPMAERAGVIYVASRDGYAYALSETTGQIQWRFSCGSPLDHEPVVVEDLLFLFPAEGSMFAVSADRGTERWRRSDVKQFLAYRRTDPKYPDLPGCLYVANKAGDTLMLDPATGGLIDTLPTSLLAIKMTNTMNDRLYMATPTGMIQCLHHPQLDEPLWHLPAPAPEDVKPKVPAASAPAGEAAEPSEEGAEPDPFEEAPAGDAAPEDGEPAEMEAPADEEAPAEEEAAAPAN